MKIGLFADTHDHVDHVRLAVERFNRENCELVIFAGDFVSPIVVPPLRQLNARVFACFGDNEGNRRGISGGMRIVGPVASPPVGCELPDGTRLLLTHMPSSLGGDLDEADVIVSAHTHRPKVTVDDAGRLHVNPGETSGWTFRRPTIAVLETDRICSGSDAVTILDLLPDDDPFRRRER